MSVKAVKVSQDSNPKASPSKPSHGRRSSLGMGLNELLSGLRAPVESPEGQSMEGGRVMQLNLDALQPGKYQPRRNISSDSLEELAASIRHQGVVQPLIVRDVSPGCYEIVAGERRWRAAQLAGLKTVPVLVRTMSDQQASAVALIENIQREDLNAIETALGVQRLIEEFQLTHEMAAQAIGKSRATVTNLLRLLTLNEKVQAMVRDGMLEMGHARALLALDERLQLQAAKQITHLGLSVRECEALVRKFQQSSEPSESNQILDPNIKALERQLSERWATKVQVKHTKKGSGKLIIYYSTSATLNGLLERFR